MLKKPAVFMDRDGTVNEQMGYINHVDRFVLLPGAGEAIRLLNEAGYLAIIVSNQSGVARGYFPVDLVYRVHDKMTDLIKKEGAVLDGIYFCPHYPNGKVSPYGIRCDCRKPGTGLIRKACTAFDIDMEHSFVIGDRCSDIEMAHRARSERDFGQDRLWQGGSGICVSRVSLSAPSCGGRPFRGG